jgi:DNA-binding LacI/PurR family transcriptional regulator
MGDTEEHRMTGSRGALHTRGSALGRRPVLADVARLASVSPTTASSALRGTGRMAQKTRDRVLAAASRLAYETDRRASALRRRRSGVLGLVMPDVSGVYRWRLARAIETEARRRGFFLSLCFSYGGRDLEQRLVRTLVGEGVEGLLLFGPISRGGGEDVDHLLRLRELGIPFLYVDVYTDHVSAPFVGTDNVLAARLATEHLLKLGHRRIAYLSAPVEPTSAMRERLQGFSASLADWGVGPRPQFVIERPTAPVLDDGDPFDPNRQWREIAPSLGRKLSSLTEPPSAIVCATTDDACVALRWACDQGLSIPEHLSLVRFDDFPFLPAVGLEFTFVRQPAEEIGSRALEALVSEISGARSGRPVQVRLAPKLVIGNTTARPPVDEEEVIGHR